LAVLAALTILTLILPNIATTMPGPQFSTSQLVFAAIVSLVLYGSFVFIQTLRHHDYFLPVDRDEEAHVLPPSKRTAAVSGGARFASDFATAYIIAWAAPQDLFNRGSGVDATEAVPAAVVG
jgi:Ca2+:H+ antiporter